MRDANAVMNVRWEVFSPEGPAYGQHLAPHRAALLARLIEVRYCRRGEREG